MSASPKTANAVQTRLRELFKTIKQIEDARRSSENTLQATSHTHRRVQSDEKLTLVDKNKLIGLCEDAVKDAEKEEDALRKALDKIYDVRRIRHEIRLAARNAGNKETIPLWVGRDREEPPPLCGAVSSDGNYVAKPGDMVAALVRSPDGDENWILAEVVSYNHSR